MFPGIEGGEWSLGEPRRALRDGGAEGAIRTHQWRWPFGWVLNLTDYKANREDAVGDAEQITEYCKDWPSRPIDLVAYSGGAGVALMVAEELPEDVRLRNIILIHGAVSPDYDLSRALERVDGKIINFCSERDWFMLGVGTSVLGTIDRSYTNSAGKDGFDPDLAVPDAEMREQLEQIFWSSEMISTGHFGGHATIMSYDWTKKYVAPYLSVSEPLSNEN